MTTTLSILRQLPETKAEIQLFADKTIDMIKEGCEDPIDLSIRLKALEETIKQIRAGIKDIALEEAEKNGKEFDYKSAKISIGAVGVKYDFSNCQDTEWELLDSEVKFATDRKKERESFLKNIKGQITTVDTETGETNTIYEPIKSGSENIKITIL